MPRPRTMAAAVSPPEPPHLALLRIAERHGRLSDGAQPVGGEPPFDVATGLPPSGGAAAAGEKKPRKATRRKDS